MATIENALVYLLNATGALTAVNGLRIWDTKMPDNPVLPATTFQQIAKILDHTTSDRSTLKQKVYHIQHWSKDKAEVIAMAQATEAQLDAFRGTVQVDGAGQPIGILSGITSADGSADIVINAILLQNELDLYDDDTRVFRRLQQFRVTYQEN